MSAHQIHRMLGVRYQTAWFMMHRLRYAMSVEPMASKLRGVVEMDETYMGGKRKYGKGRVPSVQPQGCARRGAGRARRPCARVPDADA